MREYELIVDFGVAPVEARYPNETFHTVVLALCGFVALLGFWGLLVTAFSRARQSALERSLGTSLLRLSLAALFVGGSYAMIAAVPQGRGWLAAANLDDGRMAYAQWPLFLVAGVAVVLLALAGTESRVLLGARLTDGRLWRVLVLTALGGCIA